jgi:hypothetical protein
MKTLARSFERLVRASFKRNSRLKDMVLGRHLSAFTPSDMQTLVAHRDWPMLYASTPFQEEAKARYEIARKALVGELISSLEGDGWRTMASAYTDEGYLTDEEKCRLREALQTLLKDLDSEGPSIDN